MFRLFFSIVVIVVVLLPMLASSQSPVYAFRDFTPTSAVPKNINSTRSAVVVSVSDKQSSFLIEGDWKKLSNEVHASLYKMGIDAVIYLNENDFLSGASSGAFYQSILTLRSIKNLLFVTVGSDGAELICAPYNGKNTLIDNSTDVYFRKSNGLNGLMLEFARDVKRADYPMLNFLIPNKPTFLDALSIVEKSNLRNYPGQVRRSKLAVERFQKLELPKGASQELQEKISTYNAGVEQKNTDLEEVIRALPYDTEMIDFMSDEDLLRKRYQFVLRSLYASGESIRSMLKYDLQLGEGGYVSVIPVMPDNTSIKTLPKKALVHKFYIRQNIAKNVYVGEWDADEKWQDALQNYLGNMSQYFNKGN